MTARRLGAREWLVLSRLPGLGAARLAELAATVKAWPDGWLALLPREAATSLRLWLDHPGRSPLSDEIARAEAWLAEAPDRHLLHPGHPHWPTLLTEIPDPPPLLWAWGDLSALAAPRLAVVGARRATREGLTNAATLSRELAGRGWCVVSGMALGIDAAAQQAALDAGGASVAVLGCGVDVVYPPRHHRLHGRLRQPGGLLLAEHPPGTPARPAFFPRRNRIVTGLSFGVLVVEAAERSGSLITARLAAEYGRDVMAVPGHPLSPGCAGSNRLLQEGAQLMTGWQDLDHSFGPDCGGNDAWETALTPDQARVLAEIDTDPVALETLAFRLTCSPYELYEPLMALEMAGLIAAQGSSYQRIR